MADIKALGDPRIIKRELESLIPRDDNDDLAHAINALSFRVANPSSIKKFEKGDNFAKFCERFMEHITINQISAENSYLVFLQNIQDDNMYTLIKSIQLTPEQKINPEQFIQIFRDRVYGENLLVLRNELHSCTQKKSESVSEYAHRLRDKSSIAYPNNPNQANDDCLIVFLRGLFNPVMKRKVNENIHITDFTSAVKLAKNLENVDKMLTSSERQVDFALACSSSTEKSNANHEENHRVRSSTPYPQRDRRSSSRSPYRGRTRHRSSSRESDKSWSNNQRRYQSRRHSRNRSTSRSYSSSPDSWKSSSSRSRSKRDFRCHFCGKKGHFMKDCYSYNNSSKSKSRHVRQITKSNSDHEQDF